MFIELLENIFGPRVLKMKLSGACNGPPAPIIWFNMLTSTFK